MHQPSAKAFQWWPPGDLPALPKRGIHVWRVALAADPEAVACAARLLDAEERLHAERLRTEELRRRFILRRARLRQILSLYMAERPGLLRFERGQYGKPRLAEPRLRKPIEFSASHSADWALVAVAAGRPVGIDIERVRPLPDLQELCRNYFAPSENEALARLVSTQRLETFFRLWVCKEAVLKALGTGLSLGLDQVVVSADTAPPRLVALGGDAHRALAWRLEFLPSAAGFFAAVAWEESGLRRGPDAAPIELFDLPPDWPSMDHDPLDNPAAIRRIEDRSGPE